MHFSIAVLAVLCSSFIPTLSNVIHCTNQRPHRGAELESRTKSGLEKRDRTGNYTNPYVRKEWRVLSLNERKQYTDAVLCLRKKPSRYPEVKGSKSRFDDFQVLHIIQTFVIHFNAQFLAWHRWFTWTYEQALRQECGYKGYQPYWDWTLDAADIVGSPLFDGSPYSMSGNGEFIPNRSDFTTIFDLPSIPLLKLTSSPGTGGGCVTTGPFANATVPFGPVNRNVFTSLLNNPDNLAYKPHCLRRDLNPKGIRSSLTSANVKNLLESPNIAAFQKLMQQGPGTGNGDVGVHTGGHLSVGEDMIDVFSSPGDPMFFLHHAQIDRLWTLWQTQNPKERQYAISGTGTFFNYPSSPEFHLNDTMDLGKLAPGGPQPIRNFLNTFGGPFCYEYA